MWKHGTKQRCFFIFRSLFIVILEDVFKAKHKIAVKKNLHQL
jgi:hypothetical protein